MFHFTPTPVILIVVVVFLSSYFRLVPVEDLVATTQTLDDVISILCDVIVALIIVVSLGVECSRDGRVGGSW